MTNEKNINEIIRNLKRELKAAQKTIAFLITENSTTKTKLAEQHHFIQTANTIFSRLPGSIYWKGRNGVYLGCSDDMCNFLGMSRDQIIGHNDDYIGHILGWPKEIAAKAMKDDHDVIFNNAPRLNTEELPFSDKTGKIIHLITSKVPLLDNSGEVIGVLGFSVDISERKRMEEDLKRAKEAAEAADIAKTAFIANMSHDIRTPLSGVVGLGEIIEREIENPKHKNMVHDMVRSSYELLNMLNEILDVISLDSVTIEDVHEEPFDLLHLIQTIIDLEKSSVDLKKIALLNSLDTQIPTVLYGDHKKVHHIVLNLVGNAIKFTKEGHVEIRIKLLEKTNDIVKILFEITDTGIGIPPENLGKIFDLFYKVTPSHKGLDKGHGIGLHIVKTYTELLGGKINVESKVNEGSKFSFSLTFKIPNKDAVPKNMQSPVTTPSEKPPVIIGNTQVVPATVPTRDIGPNAPKILIIEDNNVVRMVEEDTVSAIHCKATTANDGETGLELAKNQSFDLILTDIGLPGISGIEFAKLLRQYRVLTTFLRKCNISLKTAPSKAYRA